MRICLSQGNITEIQSEYAVSLVIGDSYNLRLETPFRMVQGEETATVDPEAAAVDAILAKLDRFRNSAVLEMAINDETGQLTLIFDDASRIEVDADESYESWELSGADGLKIVCQPGGSLAIWEPDSRR